jgi:type I restriction enzyme S subunit
LRTPASIYPFADVIDFQEGPGIMAADFRDEGVPLIRLSGLSSLLSVLEGCNYLDPDMVRKKWQHFRLREGDTLLSTSAALGRVAVVGAEAEGAIPYTGIIRMRPRNDSIDASFIPYALLGSEFQQQAEAVGVGSVMRHFGPSHLRGMGLTLPSPATQRKIAAVLSAYDDLIDNDNRRIQLLEEMGRRIYHEWFVEFHYPGHQQVPHVPSQLGPIPRGWQVGTLDGLVRDVREGVTTGGVTAERPYVPIDCITARSLVLRDWRPGSEAASSLLTFHRGDLLFGAMRPYFHKVALAPWAGTTRATCFVLRVRQRESYSFATLSLSDPKTIDFATAHASGTTIPYAKWRDSLATMTILVPEESVMRRFEQLVRPMLDWLTDAGLTIANLRAARDLLLPRLISGEIDVTDLDIAMPPTAA